MYTYSVENKVGRKIVFINCSFDSIFPCNLWVTLHGFLHEIKAYSLILKPCTNYWKLIVSICFRFWYPGLTMFLENLCFLILNILCIEPDIYFFIQNSLSKVFNLYVFHFLLNLSLLLANIEKKQSYWYKGASSMTPVELIASQLCGVYFLVGSLVLLSPGAARVSSYLVRFQRWPR